MLLQILNAVVVGGAAGDADAYRILYNGKMAVLLKNLSNFFRSLEMPLFNCKITLELRSRNDCVMSSIIGATTFQIKSKKLYVPIVTLSTKDNVNLTKQLNEGFKRSVYRNEYKSKIETKEAIVNVTRFPLDTSFQGVNRLFVLVFENTNIGDNRAERNSRRKYFLSRVDITNYNVLTDGRNFYDQLINDQIKNYYEIRKIATGKEDDYTTGCLLDYQYFKGHYQFISVDLSKQRELDADPRAIAENSLPSTDVFFLT